jgi:hypothetical protein
MVQGHGCRHRGEGQQGLPGEEEAVREEGAAPDEQVGGCIYSG